MRPAASLIIFTSLSGLGFGLCVLIGGGFLVAGGSWWVFIHACLVLGLISVGIMSSTLHLGHPERAWRALSQWRTSWLSREGVLAAIAVMVLVIFFADNWFFGEARRWLGIVAALLSLATIYSTAMIYASLKTIARWHHGLTPLCFVAIGLSGGFVAATALAALEGRNVRTLALLGMVSLVVATVLKVVWWVKAGAKGSGSTPETATGLEGHVRPLMPPHTEENWLQHEMGFVLARKHSMRLAAIGLALGTFIPLIGLGFGQQSPLILIVILLSHIAGVIIERWLFFAEAKHTVMLYYGARH